MKTPASAPALIPLCFFAIACTNTAPTPSPQAVPPAATMPGGVAVVAPTPIPKTISLSSPEDEKGATLIRTAVDGMGGVAVVDGVKALELRGKATRMFPGGNNVDFASTTYLLFPDHYRQDVTLPMGSLVTVWSPQGAFTDMGDGPVILPDAQRTAMEQGFRRNLVGLMKARTMPGFRATAKGAGTTSTGDAVELVEVASQGHTTILGIDAASGRILLAKWQGRIGAGGEPGETVTEFSDFKSVPGGGLIYPYALSSVFAGNPTHSVALESVVVNGALDPALFEPKGAPVPAEPAQAPAPAAPPATAPVPPPPTPAAGGR
jgi:hypothetical protein